MHPADSREPSVWIKRFKHSYHEWGEKAPALAVENGGQAGDLGNQRGNRSRHRRHRGRPAISRGAPANAFRLSLEDVNELVERRRLSQSKAGY